MNGVQLEWIPPVKNASAITGYAIWRRSLDAGDTELTLLTADTGNADVAYLDQTPTVTGDRFEYRVVALRGSVVSAGSNLALIKYEHPSDSSLQSFSVHGKVTCTAAWSSTRSTKRTAKQYSCAIIPFITARVCWGTPGVTSRRSTTETG